MGHSECQLVGRDYSRDRPGRDGRRSATAFPKALLTQPHRAAPRCRVPLHADQERATELNKPVVGTEDLLWATFQVDHTTSRSRAMDRLRERGVNMDLVWGNAILSENAQQALSRAIEEQR